MCGKNNSCALQLCRTVKIQVGDLVSSTMEYQLTVNSRASDLLAQFQRQSVRSPENGKGKMRRYNTAQSINDYILTHMLKHTNHNHPAFA